MPQPGFNRPTGNPTQRAHWARLIKKVYEVDPLECPRFAAPMRVIAPSEKPNIIERILKHLNRWLPKPEHPIKSGPDPPWPKDTTLPLTFHPVPDIA